MPMHNSRVRLRHLLSISAWFFPPLPGLADGWPTRGAMVVFHDVNQQGTNDGLSAPVCNMDPDCGGIKVFYPS
jgi:hypothetical protein